MNYTENFPNVRVLVVGDVMLDRYWWGSVNRVSPEAPVPVVNLESVSATAGGAANVAANVAGLGAQVFLIGIVGKDKEAKLLKEVLAAQNVSGEFLIESTERPTTVKTRVVAHNQQVVRVDQEANSVLSQTEEEAVWRTVQEVLTEVEIIIFSDYGKGIATENTLSRLITSCIEQNKFIFIDPKGKNYQKYRGAMMLTPNRFEIAEACGLENSNQAAIDEAGGRLLNELELKYLLVTQGEEGMTLYERDGETIHLPVESRNVYDVTGAGDTVIACLAVAFGGGADFADAAKFANRAAGLVIERIGTTAISLEMLNQ